MDIWVKGVFKKYKRCNFSNKTLEEIGKASDCNWGARQLSLAISDHSDRGSGGEPMKNYNKFYKMCMEN